MTAQAEARPLNDDELLITRVFNAPVSLVFRVWEKPEHMSRWLGPVGFTCTGVEIDFRPGGAWHGTIQSPSIGPAGMGGRYREIERDRRIVFTFAWDDGRDQPGIEQIITVTFREQAGKTVMEFHQAPFIHVEARNQHIHGWNACFDRLQAYAEQLAKGDAR
jgi:uncharacterized protein YndB with AHSA1/START domain